MKCQEAGETGWERHNTRAIDDGADGAQRE